MVERNVVFNGNDITTESHTTILVDVSAEGEKDKIIQQPSNSAKINETPDIPDVSNPKLEQKISEDQPSNSVPFPSTSDAMQETEDNDQTQRMDAAISQENHKEPTKN